MLFGDSPQALGDLRIAVFIEAQRLLPNIPRHGHLFIAMPDQLSGERQ